MKKKIIAVVAAAALLSAVITGCGQSAPPANNAGTGAATTSSEAAPAATPLAGADYTVYLITMDKMDQHWVSVDKGAGDMARALGINYKWDAPDVKDNAKQIECINNAVADGSNLILLAANDPTAVSEAVKNAKSKGVQIIYVDSGADEPALESLSTDNYNAGKLAGTTMLDALKAAGKTSGKIGIIGVNTATNSTISRENGFRAAIDEAGGYTLLTTEYKNGDAAASQDAAAGFISGNSDLVGIFGTNEGSTVGTGNAIKASGKDVIGVGFDKSDAINSLLQDGSLLASMAQNPYTMGYLGMAQAFGALSGYSLGPAVIDTGVAVLKKS
ncbi:MAG: substrate-binding domain-containing protein [Clostridiales Family XIII bacterium]|jgi:ribose transport system substrate-binding protein|nr:substrate-binding domain-containing protein [Clostridiales Family XIII bacterium]